jgi:hypothetical protein
MQQHMLFDRTMVSFDLAGRLRTGTGESHARFLGLPPLCGICDPASQKPLSGGRPD